MKKIRMSFPVKFKDLLEKKKGSVEPFEGAWITWAVCGCEDDSCGWEGWILEDVFKKNEGKIKHLPSQTDQICPRCSKELFRTEVQYKVRLDEDQTPERIEGIDYESAPITYK
tara:strand:+ start:858 stop:1196 length:339 start_codon:yes stop_codon:yes gene_type:complete